MVALRPADGAGQAEYLDFQEATGLSPEKLELFTIDSTTATLPNLDDYDGIFVGGSPFNVTDLEHSELQKHSHDLMYEVLSSPVPALFTCYGASFTAFTFGGLVNRDYGESAGPTVVELTEAAARDRLAADLPSTFHALTGHKEAIAVLPENAVLLASGPTCPVQMYSIGSNNWITQFHPELSAAGFMRRLMFYKHDGYFKESEIEEIRQRAYAQDLSGAALIVSRFTQMASRHANSVLSS